MQELFKKWASESNTYEEFDMKYSLWLIFQEIDPDNCYSDDELKRYYKKFKT